MLKVVKDIIQQPNELENSSVFYAFSYYFDHAVQAGLVGERNATSKIELLELTLA